MKKNNFLNSIFVTGCILILLTGCSTSARQIPPSTDESSKKESSVSSETPSETSDYITLAQAKSAVLENAGLSEENVKFVRTHLDSDRDVAAYDIEFICENAEYDYTVHAVTGEILSMNCETATYDMDAVSPDGTQSADTQSDAELQSDTKTQQSNSTDAQKPLANDNMENNAKGEQYIGTEAAKQAALNHAGLSEADVNFVHARLERDDGYWKYDIEFHKNNTEYDYDIDALTGEILSYDHDAEYFQHGADASPAAEQITEDKAKEIALNHAGVAEKDTQRMKVKLDYDDGRAEYEVEWHVGRTEYSCDIDAYTGDILSFEKELD